MFSEWSIVLKYAIILQLTIKLYNCCVAYYVRDAPYLIVNLSFIVHCSKLFHLLNIVFHFNLIFNQIRTLYTTIPQ
jgi:hypothetical protein